MTFKAGQFIRCTLTKLPRSENACITVERLMRLDPGVKRGLRKAHMKRQQNLNVYNRGNRDWTSRAKCGKLVRLEKGEAWTMCFDHSLQADLASVAACLKIEAA